MLEEFKRRREFVLEHLSGIRDVSVNTPDGTFFVFLGVGKFYGKKFKNRIVKNSVDLADYLLDHLHVATSPGSAFGDDGCLRISYACSMSELEAGMKRLKAGLEELNHG
jgi:aspartate aminotransferase